MALVPGISLEALACGAALLGVVAGCRDDRAEEHSARAGGSAARLRSAEARSKPAEPPPAGLPADLEPSSVSEELGCASAARGLRQRACELVAEFAQAQDVTWFPPIGQAVWCGEIIVLPRGSAERRDYGFLQVRPGRGRSRLGAKAVMEYSVAIARVGNQPEQRATEAFLSSLREAKGMATPSSLGRFVEAALPEEAFRALERTQGASLRFGDPGAHHYLRQREERLLLLGRRASDIEAGAWWPVTATR
jgi:hypothetical protein